MRELSIQCENYGTAEENGKNILSALERKLPTFSPALCAHDGVFVVVASGPSMPSQIEAIRSDSRSRPICAINGAYDHLIDAGIVPNLFLTVDPRPMPQNVTKPHQDTIFLLASRVNPELFDRLREHKVMLWHSFGAEAEHKFYAPAPSVGGGSTSGLRAITIGWLMGFRRFVLYGMDSCLADDKLTKRFTGEKAGVVVDVIVGGKTFYCNGAMAQQAQEFQELYRTFPGISIDCRGGGLLAAIIEERKKAGMPA